MKGRFHDQRFNNSLSNGVCHFTKPRPRETGMSPRSSKTSCARCENDILPTRLTDAKTVAAALLCDFVALHSYLSVLLLHCCTYFMLFVVNFLTFLQHFPVSHLPYMFPFVLSCDTTTDSGHACNCTQSSFLCLTSSVANIVHTSFVCCSQ